MTVFVQNTALTNTYDFWRNRTNELADAMSTKTITVNSNTTTGNAVVNGTFQANNLHIVNALRGGNNSTSATLTITSNLTVNGTLLTVGNSIVNVTTNSTSIKISNSTISSILNLGSLILGNSTVNTTVNSTIFTGTSLFANSSLFANASISNAFTVGTFGYFVSNGNFGLSNSTPTTKFSVNGNSHFTGSITVTGNIVSNAILKVYNTSNSQLFP